MKSHALTCTIYDAAEQPIKVHARWYPPAKPRRGDYGEPLEPESEGIMEIEEPADLTEAQTQAALDELWSQEI